MGVADTTTRTRYQIYANTTAVVAVTHRESKRKTPPYYLVQKRNDRLRIHMEKVVAFPDRVVRINTQTNFRDYVRVSGGPCTAHVIITSSPSWIGHARSTPNRNAQLGTASAAAARTRRRFGSGAPRANPRCGKAADPATAPAK